MYVLAVGNPFDGMTFYGPFDSAQKALDWIEGSEGHWWVVLVQEVEDASD